VLGEGATTLGLVGTSTSLVMQVSRPAREMGYAALTGTKDITARTSDQMTVSYFLADPQGGALQAAVAKANQDPLRPKPIAGLARMEGDRLAAEYGDTKNPVAQMAESVQVLAPEVISLQFRYFDGTNWYDSWDTSSFGALPRAVEVTLGFEQPPARKGSMKAAASTTQQVGRSVRQVIAVPLSQPTAESTTTN
jgi:hypothetical protein